MINRLTRILLGMLLIITMPFTIVPFIIVWILIGKFLILNLLDYVILNEPLKF